MAMRQSGGDGRSGDEDRQRTVGAMREGKKRGSGGGDPGEASGKGFDAWEGRRAWRGSWWNDQGTHVGGFSISNCADRHNQENTKQNPEVEKRPQEKGCKRRGGSVTCWTSRG